MVPSRVIGSSAEVVADTTTTQNKAKQVETTVSKRSIPILQFWVSGVPVDGTEDGEMTRSDSKTLTLEAIITTFHTHP
jgi:hypothetical protein